MIYVLGSLPIQALMFLANFRTIALPTSSCRKILGHIDIRVTQNVLTPSGLVPSRSVWLECIAAEAPKIPFIAESAECKSIQRWFGNICGQIGLRASGYD